jgi:hypothetical protein
MTLGELEDIAGRPEGRRPGSMSGLACVARRPDSASEFRSRAPMHGGVRIRGPRILSGVRSIHNPALSIDLRRTLHVPRLALGLASLDARA